jgi:hypothetical protein
VEVFPQGRGRFPAPRSLSDKKNVTWPAPVRQIAVNCVTPQLKARFLGRLRPCATFRDQTVIATSAPSEPLDQLCHRAHGRRVTPCGDRPDTTARGIPWSRRRRVPEGVRGVTTLGPYEVPGSREDR